MTVVLDRPGLAAYIPRNGAPPIGPFFISNGGLAKVQDELAPEVARAADGGGLLDTLIPVAAGVAGAVALGAILSGDGDDGGDGRQQPTNQNPNNNSNSTNDRPRSPNNPNN